MINHIKNSYLVFKRESKKIKNYLLGIPLFELEIHAAHHCNLNCKSCSHFSPLFNNEYPDLDIIEYSLKRLKKVNKEFKEIRILGGEPLLNPNIIKLLEIVRKYFYKQRIILLTNGILLAKMAIPFWETLRKLNIELSLTIYPQVNEKKFLNIIKDKGIKTSIYSNRNIKKTWRTFLLDEKKKNRRINYFKCGENNCWQLYEDKIFPCPTAAYSHALNKNFNTNFSLKNSDYINLNKKLTAWKFLNFSLMPKPFCNYCCLPRDFTDWEISHKTRNEWIK